jgi:calcium permeable stress-gated cation channel
MMLITFSLFWFTYRYQMIYVSYAKAETNGLIFPKAVNQLFTGLYFLQLCLIGLFLLQRDLDNKAACFPQAIIMIVTLGATVIYQFILNSAFGPLFTYLPITFEDEAVERDEEWQRAQASRWEKDDAEHQSLTAQAEGQGLSEDSRPAYSKENSYEKRQSSMGPGSYELSNLDNRRSSHGLTDSPDRSRRRSKSNWAEKSRHSSQSRSRSHSHANGHKNKKHKDPLNFAADALKRGLDDVTRPVRDIEAQILPSKNLFDDVDDELADIEPSARQKLIKRSFQHPATRALQPAVWIPHDDLGIAKDEIQRTSAFTKKIWITSINARLDAKGQVMYRGLPPDRDPFENIEV